MQNTRLSESLNGNKAGPGKARTYAGSSGRSLGYSVGHSQGVREESAPASRVGNDHAPSDTRRSFGGQASLPLFGLPGGNSRPAQGKAQPQAQESQPAPALAPSTGESLASLTRRQIRANEAHAADARRQRFLATQQATPAPAKAAAVAPPAPLSIRLSRERLSIFATLATIEQRPLDEVIAECLADMAAHLARTRHQLHLDAENQAQLDAYLDSLERDDEEAQARAATTSAMQLTCYASDAREAYPHVTDDEHADFLHRADGVGYVEFALAMD